MPALTISRESLYLRLFLWVWEVDPEKLNICKLFWGTIFFFLPLFTYKKAYRFIPRISILYLVVGTIFLGLQWWFSAVVWLGIGTIILIGAYLFDARKKVQRETREGGEKRLSKITEKCGGILDWLLENTLGRLIEFGMDVGDSGAGYRIGEFFGVIAQYFRAVKHRFCPMVRIVD